MTIRILVIVFALIMIMQPAMGQEGRWWGSGVNGPTKVALLRSPGDFWKYPVLGDGERTLWATHGSLNLQPAFFEIPLQRRASFKRSRFGEGFDLSTFWYLVVEDCVNTPSLPAGGSLLRLTLKNKGLEEDHYRIDIVEDVSFIRSRLSAIGKLQDRLVVKIPHTEKDVVLHLTVNGEERPPVRFPGVDPEKVEGDGFTRDLNRAMKDLGDENTMAFVHAVHHLMLLREVHSFAHPALLKAFEGEKDRSRKKIGLAHVLAFHGDAEAVSFLEKVTRKSMSDMTLDVRFFTAAAMACLEEGANPIPLYSLYAKPDSLDFPMRNLIVHHGGRLFHAGQEAERARIADLYRKSDPDSDLRKGLEKILDRLNLGATGSDRRWTFD